MKFIGIVFGLTLVLAVAVFVAISVIDVPVEQTEVTKTIPNDRIYNQGGSQ